MLQQASQIFDETVTRVERIQSRITEPTRSKRESAHNLETLKMCPSRYGSTTSQPGVIACSLFFCLALLVVCSAAAFGQTNEFQLNLAAGPTGVLVHSQLGGQIFGYDIDQNGTEGLLAEAKILNNGNVLAAVR